MEKSMEAASKPYENLIQKEFERITGLKSSQDLQTCFNSQNDTVLDCPISKNPDQNMTVIVHNPSSLSMNQFVRLRLPSNLYKVQKWVSESKAFQDTQSDILEQKHISGDRKESTDYLMFVPGNIQPNDLAIYKVVRVEKPV
jgi:hypothetical protein